MSILTDEMTWSFSRVSSFIDCPYKFFLHYIRGEKEAPRFFSDYGTLLHDLLAGYLRGDIPREQLPAEYLLRFRGEVRDAAPSRTVFQNYFRDGLGCLQNIPDRPEHILAVEKKLSFSVGGFPFIGFADLILLENSRLAIVDHKSRALTPRSPRRRRANEELDRYLRQLYLYSIPVAEEYGEPPGFLAFHCFRTREIITEPYRAERCEEAKQWAADTIRAAARETRWKPDIEPFRCRYLCGVSDRCDYYQMYKGG